MAPTETAQRCETDGRHLDSRGFGGFFGSTERVPSVSLHELDGTATVPPAAKELRDPRGLTAGSVRGTVADCRNGRLTSGGISAGSKILR